MHAKMPQAANQLGLRRLARRHSRALAAGLVGLVALTAPIAALADEAEPQPSLMNEAGLGIGAGVSNVIYTPLKICYAAGGLVVGGLAWAFSGGDREVARIVVAPAITGDYVLTPAHLKGERSLDHFFGRDPRFRDDWGDPAANVASKPPAYEEEVEEVEVSDPYEDEVAW